MGFEQSFFSSSSSARSSPRAGANFVRSDSFDQLLERMNGIESTGDDDLARTMRLHPATALRGITCQVLAAVCCLTDDQNHSVFHEPRPGCTG